MGHQSLVVLLVSSFFVPKNSGKGLKRVLNEDEGRQPISSRVQVVFELSIPLPWVENYVPLRLINTIKIRKWGFNTQIEYSYNKFVLQIFNGSVSSYKSPSRKISLIVLFYLNRWIKILQFFVFTMQQRYCTSYENPLYSLIELRSHRRLTRNLIICCLFLTVHTIIYIHSFSLITLMKGTFPLI